MKPATFIHIGLPKTATSSLQQGLFHRHSGIQYLGKPLSAPIKKLVGAISHLDEIEYEESECSQIFDQHVKPLYDRGKPVVLSIEGLSAEYRTDRAAIASRLRRIFGGKTKILICIREQLDIMESAYLSELRSYPFRINYCSFTEYVESIYSRYVGFRNVGEPCHRAVQHFEIGNRLSRWMYYELAETYVKNFGDDNVTIVLYEEFKNDMISFTRMLCRFLCIDEGEGIQLMKECQPINVRFSNMEMNLILRFKSFNLFRRMLKKVNLNLCKAKPALSAEWRHRVRDLYRDSNHRLMIGYNLPLDRHDYPLPKPERVSPTGSF